MGDEKHAFKVVGTRPVRPDGVDKVTGRAAFGADFTLPGMIFGQVVRSPHPHARIRSIDTSAALALPGVRAVVTAAEPAVRSSPRKLQFWNQTTLAPPKKGRVFSASSRRPIRWSASPELAAEASTTSWSIPPSSEHHCS